MESWFTSLPDRLSQQLMDHYSAISDLHVSQTRSTNDRMEADQLRVSSR